MPAVVSQVVMWLAAAVSALAATRACLQWEPLVVPPMPGQPPTPPLPPMASVNLTTVKSPGEKPEGEGRHIPLSCFLFLLFCFFITIFIFLFQFFFKQHFVACTGAVLPRHLAAHQNHVTPSLLLAPALPCLPAFHLSRFLLTPGCSCCRRHVMLCVLC